MNKGDAVQEVAYRLGNRTDLDTRIGAMMDQVQENFLEKGTVLPWFLLSEDSTKSTVASEERVAIPGDFLREYEGGALWVYDSSLTKPWVKLEKHPHDMLRDMLGQQLTLEGKPRAYSLSSDYFRLAPIPDAAYILQMKYYKKDTLPSTLADNETNLWLTNASEMVLSWTAVKMARQLQSNSKLRDMLQKDLDIASQVFWRDAEARLHSNMRYVMGIVKES